MANLLIDIKKVGANLPMMSISIEGGVELLR